MFLCLRLLYANGHPGFTEGIKDDGCMPTVLRPSPTVLGPLLMALAVGIHTVSCGAGTLQVSPHFVVTVILFLHCPLGKFLPKSDSNEAETLLAGDAHKNSVVLPFLSTPLKCEIAVVMVTLWQIALIRSPGSLLLNS